MPTRTGDAPAQPTSDHYQPTGDPYITDPYAGFYAVEGRILARLMDATDATDPWAAARRMFAPEGTADA